MAIWSTGLKCKYRYCYHDVKQSGGRGRVGAFCCGRCRTNEHRARQREMERHTIEQAEGARLVALGVPYPLILVMRQVKARYGEKVMLDTAWLIGRAIESVTSAGDGDV